MIKNNHSIAKPQFRYIDNLLHNLRRLELRLATKSRTVTVKLIEGCCVRYLGRKAMSYMYVPKPPLSYTCYVPSQCYVPTQCSVPQPPEVYYQPPTQAYAYQPPPMQCVYQPPPVTYQCAQPAQVYYYQPPAVRVQ